MWTRRQFLTRGGLLFATAGTSLAVPGGGDRVRVLDALPDGAAARDDIVKPKRTDPAIKSGLAFLKSQRHHDGSFGTDGYTGNVAVTSLAALAFMANGNQPNRGLYGNVVTDALRFVLDQDRRGTGYLFNPNGTPHGPMYGHGFGTLFLAEVSGMVQDRALRERTKATLHRAVQVILSSQNGEGGWRYEPVAREADISVTICQIMALRAAHNAGVNVRPDVITKCIRYVKNCQDLNGSFRYMLQGGAFVGNDAFARTAAGVVALYSAGIYSGREVESGLRYLMGFKPNGRRGEFGLRPDIHYFYGHYYAVQAMYIAGDEADQPGKNGTKWWSTWFPAIRDELLDTQSRDGRWEDRICTHYGTAMACLILQVPNNYLPILQK